MERPNLIALTIYIDNPLGWLTAIFTLLAGLLTGVFLIVRYFYLKMEERISKLEERILKLEDFKSEYYKELADQREIYNLVRDKEPLIRRYTSFAEQIETVGFAQWLKAQFNKP